jgi:hypothetical protein
MNAALMVQRLSRSRLLTDATARTESPADEPLSSSLPPAVTRAPVETSWPVVLLIVLALVMLWAWLTHA